MHWTSVVDRTVNKGTKTDDGRRPQSMYQNGDRIISFVCLTRELYCMTICFVRLKEEGKIQRSRSHARSLVGECGRKEEKHANQTNQITALDGCLTLDGSKFSRSTLNISYWHAWH